MKKILLVLLIVLMTIGLIVSCDDSSVKTVDEYMMKDGAVWFDSFNTLYPNLTRTSVTSITFTTDTSKCFGTGTDLTQYGTGKVMGYISGTDVFIVGDEIHGNYDCSDMFGVVEAGDFSNLTNINFGNFDASNVTDMTYMFYYCTSLTSLNFSSWNTSNVTDMNNMFSGCKSLETLDLSKFNTSKVTNMKWMFENCTSLTSLEFGVNFNTSNVKNMGYMFNICSSLKSLDLSNFNTTKVTSMRDMFANSSNLETIKGIENFDTSSVNDMGYMFYDCSSLKTLILTGSDWKTLEVTCMDAMFSGCSKLTSLNLSNFDTLKVTGMEWMFKKCTSLTDLDLSNFDITTTGTDSRNSQPDINYMFTSCTDLHKVKVKDCNSSWNSVLSGFTSNTNLNEYTKDN